jgi:hypothetical protein
VPHASNGSATELARANGGEPNGPSCVVPSVLIDAGDTRSHAPDR